MANIGQTGRCFTLYLPTFPVHYRILQRWPQSPLALQSDCHLSVGLISFTHYYYWNIIWGPTCKPIRKRIINFWRGHLRSTWGYLVIKGKVCILSFGNWLNLSRRSIYIMYIHEWKLKKRLNSCTRSQTLSPCTWNQNHHPHHLHSLRRSRWWRLGHCQWRWSSSLFFCGGGDVAT